MESILLKHIVTVSGAFKGGEGAGSVVRADMFAQTLADALANSGGIGLADMIVRSLSGHAGPAAGPGPAPRLALGSGPPPAGGRAGAVAASVLAALALSAPLAGAPTSSPFGLRADPFTGRPAHHAGLDLAAPDGTPIARVRAGRRRERRPARRATASRSRSTTAAG